MRFASASPTGRAWMCPTVMTIAEWTGSSRARSAIGTGTTAVSAPA
jgi:hypothetical protein